MCACVCVCVCMRACQCACVCLYVVRAVDGAYSFFGVFKSFQKFSN